MPCRSRLLGGSVLSTVAGLALACTNPRERTAAATEPVVYGADDRREYFELDPRSEGALLSEAMVALVGASSLDLGTANPVAAAPTLRESAGVCEGEPFAEQPAAAFCSGVLVDWDLILTAGHCARIFPLSEVRVVFGYYYEEPQRLVMAPSEVFESVAIVAERMDPAVVEPRLDYAWLRLDRPVRGFRRPARLRTSPPETGERLVALASAGGVPLKADLGGSVRFVSGFRDYFRADTDTSHGSSGGAAFDRSFSLLGILSRGGTDFTTSEDENCRRTRRADAGAAEEEFTLAGPALAELCAIAPGASSLCRADCGHPCEVLPLADARGAASEAAGCALGGTTSESSQSATCLFGLTCLVFLRRAAHAFRRCSESLRRRLALHRGAAAGSTCRSI